jgi:hypothetical protein
VFFKTYPYLTLTIFQSVLLSPNTSTGLGVEDSIGKNPIGPFDKVMKIIFGVRTFRTPAIFGEEIKEFWCWISTK